MNIKEFFNQNKVLIIGLLSACLLAVSEIITDTSGASTKVLVYAAFLAGLAFLANNLRGQWASISGIFLTALSTYVQMEQHGQIEWRTIIIQAAIAFLAVVAPPPKSRGYEHTAPITKARAEGENIQPTTIGKK